MTRWKQLPGDLPPPARDLIVQLRELKDEMGASTATLARKTAYSRSSWSRYLNGTALAQRQSVEMLARLSGADAAGLLALWELAEHAWTQRRQTEAAESETQDDAANTSRFRRHRRWIITIAVGVPILAASSLAVWLAIGGTRTSGQPTSYHCDYTRRGGRLYAGHSRTSSNIVALNGGSEDAVEVQCLLKQHGFDPGRIDGLFGKGTEHAVEKIQHAGGVVADGTVGPETWALLRA